MTYHPRFGVEKLSAGLALLVLALLMPSMAQAESVLHRGNRFEPASLDPAQANTQYERAIVGDVFEGLVTYGADGRLVPGAAGAWTPDAGGLRYTFRLRPGVKWSDGAALTAADVVFTFRRLMDPKTAAVSAPLLYVLKNARAVNTGEAPASALGVTALGEDLVAMDLESPAPYLPQLLANPFAAIVPRHAMAAAGEGWIKPGVLVSNGAFTLAAWEPQDRIVLARNPRFHGARGVKLDRVVYYPTADLSAALSRFRAGELDMEIEFPTNQIGFLRSSLAKETKLTPSLLTYYLALNTANAKLSDGRVRRALSLAIDRDILTAKVLRTGEQPAMSFVPPMIANYKPPAMDFAATPMETRLAEARRLLADAGYGPNKPLRLTYSHSANQELRRLAVVIAAMWKRIGVETALDNTEGKVFFANLRQGVFEVGFVGWLADFNDAAAFLYILQSTTQASNYSRYHSDAFDALMTRAAQTADGAARAALLGEAEQLVLADQPIIPLYFGTAKNLVAQRVTGWQPNPLDTHLSRYLNIVR